MTTRRCFPFVTLIFALWLVLSAALSTAAQTPTVTSLHAFLPCPDGATPQGGLLLASDGNFYGTTIFGGAYNYGTVFTITPNGSKTVLYSFTGGADGANPQASLIQGADGNFYGTTIFGGANNLGTVFKITPAGSETVLYSFSGYPSDGAIPLAILLQGSDGNFYGTTYRGGTHDQGTVFKVTPSGAETMLYAFTGGTDGDHPVAPLILGSDGNFYGTTYSGGAHFRGTVFKVTSAGSESVLYAFGTSTDANNPNGSLVQGSDGNFYGTTSSGGANHYGAVFKVTPSGSETVLHSFTGGADGGAPYAGLVQGTDGNFYGTTEIGGAYGYGTVFKITPAGAETVLYSFSGYPSDGATPRACLLPGLDGNFYGTTLYGGTYGCGAVFKITPSGSEAVLYAFTSSDGAVPYAGLIQGSDGNFYGTTFNGGNNNYGTVFKITPAGAETVLYKFTGAPDGATPFAGLIEGTDGNFYGTTYYGGANNYGTVFKITPAGLETVLYPFAGGTDGAVPYAGLIQGSDGNFYGTTYSGGINNLGTVFRITPAGSETVLHSFGGGPDGNTPYASLIQGMDGSFYGTTELGGTKNYGTVFRITPAGSETILYSFTGAPDGATPQTNLIQGMDGNFYSTTDSGGAYGWGTVFKISPAGSETVLYSFSGYPSDGAYPTTGLIQGSDGNFYGSTYYGGANKLGTVFKISPAGSETVLYSFTGALDGANPYAGLLQGFDGNLYGTTSNGDAYGEGGVFRLSGVYPVPAITGLSPSARDASATTFTLTVKGNSFQPFSTLDWNGSSLATTYVSATELKATVPASLIASPGKANITVVTGAGGGTSNAKTFTILLTTLKLTAANLTKNNDGSYTTNLTLKNIGYNTAPSVTITQATLGAADTSTPLPVNIGSIAAGSTGNSSLTFPASAGTSGTVVSLKVSGTFPGGKFSGSLKVTLP